MTTNRSCIDCYWAKVLGKYIPATRLDPEEFPEFDGCEYKGEGDIEKYFTVIEGLVVALDGWPRSFKFKGVEINLNSMTPIFCPFYKEVN